MRAKKGATHQLAGGGGGMEGRGSGKPFRKPLTLLKWENVTRGFAF